MLGTVNHPHVEHLALAMRDRGHRVVVGGDVEPSLPTSVLEQEGLEVHIAPRGARKTVTGLVSHVRWIRRLLDSQKPDVVHAHWMPGFAFFATLAGASPLAAMAWGSDVLLANRLRRAAGRYALRRADLVMSDSSDLLGRLEELGASPERTFLINWGVDLTIFAPGDEEREQVRQRLGLNPAPTIISPRSLLAPVYNAPTILQAFARLGDEFPDLRLLMKHMGVDHPNLGDLPHTDRVRLVGHVPYERMADYYRAAEVGLSITSSDSSPRTVWEAMACGCPMVVSDLPWVHELIEHERHALVVPIDARAVADATRRILVDRDLAAELRANGRRLVEEHRDREREMGRLANAYVHLAEEGGVPHSSHSALPA
jgi:L-malate glycosyltransferase